MPYVFLVVAIIAEVIGTTALAASQQMTRLVPSIIVVAFYTLSFYTLSFSFKAMPIGVVYAIWCGGGIVLIALMGAIVYGEKLDLPALAGLGMIIAGIAVINLFSNTTPH